MPELMTTGRFAAEARGALAPGGGRRAVPSVSAARRGTRLARGEGLDGPCVKRALRAKAADLSGALRRRVPQTRQMLERLLVGRLTLAPDAARRAYGFTGQGTYGVLFEGTVLPLATACPAILIRVVAREAGCPREESAGAKIVCHRGMDNESQP